MTTATQEKPSPACVDIDSMSERDKALFLLYVCIRTGEMVVGDDDRVYRVDDETGQRKLIA